MDEIIRWTEESLCGLLFWEILLLNCVGEIVVNCLSGGGGGGGDLPHLFSFFQFSFSDFEQITVIEFYATIKFKSRKTFAFGLKRFLFDCEYSLV